MSIDIMTLYHIAQQLLFLNHDQRKKTLNKDFKILGPTLKVTYCVFFFHHFFSKRKENYLELHKPFFLMLEAKQINSSATPKSFSIKV
jgi:hypothetical protein